MRALRTSIRRIIVSDARRLHRRSVSTTDSAASVRSSRETGQDQDDTDVRYHMPFRTKRALESLDFDFKKPLPSKPATPQSTSQSQPVAPEPVEPEAESSTGWMSESKSREQVTLLSSTTTDQNPKSESKPKLKAMRKKPETSSGPSFLASLTGNAATTPPKYIYANERLRNLRGYAVERKQRLIAQANSNGNPSEVPATSPRFASARNSITSRRGSFGRHGHESNLRLRNSPRFKKVNEAVQGLSARNGRPLGPRVHRSERLDTDIVQFDIQPKQPKEHLDRDWLRTYNDSCTAAPSSKTDAAAVHSWISLREMCKCERCVHPTTRQRTYTPGQMLEGLKKNGWMDGQPPNDRMITVTDQDVTFLWDGADHTMTLSKEQMLWKGEKFDRKSAFYNLPPRPWSNKDQLLARDPMSIPYAELYQADGSVNKDVLSRVLNNLVQSGIAMIKGVPTELTSDKECDLRHIATTIGPLRNSIYGETWNVKNKPNSTNVAYTDLNLGLHMDLLYYIDPPRFQLLHCLRNRVEGGESYFVDAFAVQDDFEIDHPSFAHILRKGRLQFEYDNDGHYLSDRKRVFSPQIDPQIPGSWTLRDRHISWSPPFQGARYPSADNFEDDRKFFEAVATWEAYVENPKYRYEFKMEEGDLVLFDNRRVLHARRAFRDWTPEEREEQGLPEPVPNEPSRWLKGCYLDMDTVIDRVLSVYKPPVATVDAPGEVVESGTSETYHKPEIAKLLDTTSSTDSLTFFANGYLDRTARLNYSIGTKSIPLSKKWPDSEPRFIPLYTLKRDSSVTTIEDIIEKAKKYYSTNLSISRYGPSELRRSDEEITQDLTTTYKSLHSLKRALSRVCSDPLNPVDPLENVQVKVGYGYFEGFPGRSRPVFVAGWKVEKDGKEEYNSIKFRYKKKYDLIKGEEEGKAEEGVIERDDEIMDDSKIVADEAQEGIEVEEDNLGGQVKSDQSEVGIEAESEVERGR